MGIGSSRLTLASGPSGLTSLENALSSPSRPPYPATPSSAETAIASVRQGAVPGACESVMLSIPRMLPDGVYHWTATHPEWEGPVSAYAIDDSEQLILIDPIAVPDVVRAVF